MTTVRVAHDLQRQLLEMTSFLRVMNSYYKKKRYLQNQIKPLISRKLKEKLTKDILSKEDSFKFPDSIMLFEAWMHLGFQALYPRVVLQFKFPGFLIDENLRNIFQFIFSTSRGFGFPIYFGPEFYHYKFTLAKIFDPLLKWSYTVSHRANQAIVVGNKRLKSKRHHLGEFESVIISEYNNKEYKGIDTLLHGYFKNEAKALGKFSSISEVLQNTTFYYSVGDHAMKVENDGINKILELPLITHESIVKEYDIDFYSYIKALLETNKLLNQKIRFYRDKRSHLINKLNRADKFKFRLEQSKHSAKEFARMSQKLSKKYPVIDKYGHYKTLLEKVRDLLFTKPLYMHTIHDAKEGLKYSRQESNDSILLSFIKKYEEKHAFNFEEEEVIYRLVQLRDQLGKMWLLFKERQFKHTLKKLNELLSFSLSDDDYENRINRLLDELLPIIAIYEIFNKSLSESVYPESVPQTKRFWSFIARFLTSKYNPIGTNLMRLFNKLAFQNWSYFILKTKMNRNEFFNYLLKLPIWKHIPINIKTKMLKHNA
jgi:hypothetical protein